MKTVKDQLRELGLKEKFSTIKDTAKDTFSTAKDSLRDVAEKVSLPPSRGGSISRKTSRKGWDDSSVPTTRSKDLHKTASKSDTLLPSATSHSPTITPTSPSTSEPTLKTQNHQPLPLAALKKFVQQNRATQIGAGGFAKVVKVRLDDGSYVAVKVHERRKGESGQAFRARVGREVDCQVKARCSGVVEVCCSHQHVS
ncbi:hypothetical protein HK097_000211 [Rhizophlyctis rosea]|uniref:Protein kinase domain-containing protein n=1 Tax=Rhizophlyctis rosea TaxID=64517 RepID=A0AAD5S5W4_9FUNG|nr:hypothetical protein HK097_000211 [Rhizophlyctis rosea]